RGWTWEENEPGGRHRLRRGTSYVALWALRLSVAYPRLTHVGYIIPPFGLANRYPNAFCRSFRFAFSQSFANFSRPMSVSGWWNIISSTLNGIVPTCAPASAASTTCMGWRSDAASTCVV